MRNMEAVRAAYRAFTDGDLDRFVGSLDPGFVSRQSEAAPWRGTYRGHEGVREMFGKVAERADATYEPAQFIEGREHIVVVGDARLTPRGTGTATTVRELHVWHVEDGRLLGLEVFLNAPAPLLAALGA
ncbi:nuclear transport factor 2 family protein [Actinomadura sp. NAK00032]|uniref:nuclear transport factor 2 family protein n=1 Tax=Actinomadura sp. NAK00032 TaxID=2742128 RepID=UPI00159087CE|nr:nuclear transport factor 2 family protein [Actinomadura sp. NAK00032]QKW36213.1 nuclear transport factor 2 family protein [Actinomadura sp. NAK00032]